MRLRCIYLAIQILRYGCFSDLSSRFDQNDIVPFSSLSSPLKPVRLELELQRRATSSPSEKNCVSWSDFGQTTSIYLLDEILHLIVMLQTGVNLRVVQHQEWDYQRVIPSLSSIHHMHLLSEVSEVTRMVFRWQ